MRKAKVQFIGTLMVSLIICWMVVVGAAAHNVHATPANGTPAASRPVGQPAIPMRANADKSGPQFTAQDAFTFASTHHMWRNESNAPWHVVSVQFLTSQQVSQLLGGESTGLPDDTLLCYVQLQGTFTFSTPTGMAASYSEGVEVFDAQTGNLLLAGGL